MVELSDPKGPVQEGIDNTIFIIPGIIVVSLISKSICHNCTGTHRQLNYYRTLTKLREGNVFTPVSLSIGGGGTTSHPV